MEVLFNIIFGGLLLVLIVWLTYLPHRKVRRKDLAFSEYLIAPTIDAFRESFPGLEVELLDEWLADFREVEKSIDRAIEEGGTARYGKQRVAERLKELHPFLVGLGLERAVDAVSRGGGGASARGR